MQTSVIKIEGLSTQQDADQVLLVLNSVWGIRKAEVSLNNHEATISYDENATSFRDFQQAIIESGYKIDQQENSLDE